MKTLKLNIDQYSILCSLMDDAVESINVVTPFELKIMTIVINEFKKKLAKKYIDHNAKKQHVKIKLSEIEIHVLHQVLKSMDEYMDPYTNCLIVELIRELDPLTLN